MLPLFPFHHDGILLLSASLYGFSWHLASWRRPQIITDCRVQFYRGALHTRNLRQGQRSSGSAAFLDVAITIRIHEGITTALSLNRNALQCTSRLSAVSEPSEIASPWADPPRAKAPAPIGFHKPAVLMFQPAVVPPAVIWIGNAV